MRLYHFTSAKYALQAIDKCRLKASDLDNVNDPYEILGFRLDSITSNQDELSAMEKVVEVYRGTISQNLKMLCLSKTCEEPSLWGHYSDGGKGVCLGFDVHKNDKHTIMKVEYGQKRQSLTYFGWQFTNGQWTPPNVTPDDVHNSPNIFKYKGVQWQHEQEWRLGSFAKDLILDAITGRYFFLFGDGLKLQEILIGFRCEEKNIQLRLERLINDGDKYPDPKPKIIFTRRSQSAFKIERKVT